MGIEELVIGDIGGETAAITNRIEALNIDLSANAVSQITFRVADSGFVLHNAGYFVLRRAVFYQDVVYEMAAIETDPSDGGHVEVTARRRPIQLLRREKGPYNFGNISPTVFASQRAASVGLEFYGQPSQPKGAIARQRTEDTDESTWDVLQKVAREPEFVCFESQGTLYFAKETYLLEHLPRVTINYFAGIGDKYYCHNISTRRSDNDDYSAEVTLEMNRQDGVTFYPGMGIVLQGLSYLNQKPFFVEQVRWDALADSPVAINARLLEKTPDIAINKVELREGMSGTEVLRLQQALDISATGLFDARTTAAVMAAQTAAGLAPTGVVNEATWEAILA